MAKVPGMLTLCPECNEMVTRVEYHMEEMTMLGDPFRRYTANGLKSFLPCGCVIDTRRPKPTGWEDLIDLIRQAEDET